MSEMSETKCNCIEADIERHLCPFRIEIFGDEESLCTCCESCTQKCVDNI